MTNFEHYLVIKTIALILIGVGVLGLLTQYKFIVAFAKALFQPFIVDLKQDFLRDDLKKEEESKIA